MGESRGFITYARAEITKQPAAHRVTHDNEFTAPLSDSSLREQGARCMDCGVPFCHRGCPLGNKIPEWNHLTSESDFRRALDSLLSTNNFPEFTGRVCPAPCETSCVLGINEDPVSIEHIEMSLVDKGFELGWMTPKPPERRTGKTIAVVGSGPAGLAAAQQLNRMGHKVTVFERAEQPGGLLMFGIPDFKLEKWRVQRRIQLLESEGIEFRCGVSVGKDVLLAQLQHDYSAILLACGATQARDIRVPGRDAQGVVLAMDFLSEANREILKGRKRENRMNRAAGKDVIVIGGGDTGADCIGTAHRQGARSITQFEILPHPPVLPRFPHHNERTPETPWPEWPLMLRTSTSHEEGCQREFGIESVRFEHDSEGGVSALVTRSVRLTQDEHGSKILEPVANSEKRWPCQLALIAIGFSGTENSDMIKASGIELTPEGRIRASQANYMTPVEGIFAAGDARRGQSLVVWAIAEGRKAANAIDVHLQNSATPISN